MVMPWDDFIRVLLVGCLSGALGTGASLALPALFALGMPAATALLAFKLPLAVADLAAAACLQRQGVLPRAGLGPQLGLVAAAAAGALSLFFESWLFVPCALGACLLLFTGVRPWRVAAPLTGLGLWIGVCGVGAGLALLAVGRRVGDSVLEAAARARALGAAANLAAVAVIATHARVPWSEVFGLTCALALGSLVGASLAGRLGAAVQDVGRRRRMTSINSTVLGPV